MMDDTTYCLSPVFASIELTLDHSRWGICSDGLTMADSRADSSPSVTARTFSGDLPEIDLIPPTDLTMDATSPETRKELESSTLGGMGSPAASTGLIGGLSASILRLSCQHPGVDSSRGVRADVESFPTAPLPPVHPILQSTLDNDKDTSAPDRASSLNASTAKTASKCLSFSRFCVWQSS